MSGFARRSERGAVIIQVAIALLGLTAFSAFVFDYGVLWVSRGQAQNSADAGAHAAAVALYNDPADTAAAVSAAQKFANENTVWLENTSSTNVLVQTGLTCPPGSGGGTGCVRVDVIRGGADRNNTVHTNYLPTFFANLFGMTTQAINATATSQVSSGNAVTCIKPWIVADKWTDTTPDIDPAPYAGDSFDREDTFIPGTDTYSSTSGFNPTQHSGYQMPLKAGNVGEWSAGWAMEIDFGQTGSAAMEENIRSCPTWVPTVGIWNPTGYASNHPGDDCNGQNDPDEPAMGCLSVKPGMSVGPTEHGVDDLVSLDTAHWTKPGDADYVNDPDTTEDDLGYVISACQAAHNCEDWDGNPQSISPRIVPIAVFDTTAFAAQTCSGTGCVARVVNLGGFFIEGMCTDIYPVQASRPAWCGTASEAGKVVIGRFMKYPGQWSGMGGTTTSTFAKAVRLVR